MASTATLGSGSFFDPEPAKIGKTKEILSGDQVETWRSKGALHLSGVLSEQLVESLRTEIGDIAGGGGTKFGIEGELTFPSPAKSINQASVHMDIIRIAKQLLGTTCVRLTQAEAWEKTGVDKKRFEKRKPRESHDQRIHCDYPNHTLVHPSNWDNPDAVSFILYLSDYEKCAGGTAVVLREGKEDPAYTPGASVLTPGVTGHWINDREMAETNYRSRNPDVYKFRQSLYKREVCTRYKKGSLLVYRQDLWHRGTRVTPGAQRYVMNITYRRKDAEWIGNWQGGWAKRNYLLCWPERRLESTIANLLPPQRTVLGFPEPGHRYWNKFTLAAVAARYSKFGMDMEPYRKAMLKETAE
mmetsp:Transcript_31792/g.44498  ORF Transcript_31792/g.44498 Transcript_31792/m.44498 type:complete len:356 (+) Transcript_31792:67-1134(+)|eukprot:jgi/Bigna1/86335/estExt_fgenesh1_pg.C_90324